MRRGDQTVMKSTISKDDDVKRANRAKLWLFFLVFRKEASGAKSCSKCWIQIENRVVNSSNVM